MGKNNVRSRLLRDNHDKNEIYTNNLQQYPTNIQFDCFNCFKGKFTGQLFIPLNIGTGPSSNSKNVCQNGTTD